MTRRFFIYILPSTIDQTKIEYQDIVNYPFNNSKNDNVIELIEADFILLEKLFDIINAFNNSNLGYYEDGCIDDNRIKIEILEKVSMMGSVSRKREKELVDRFKTLLKSSIIYDRIIFFHF